MNAKAPPVPPANQNPRGGAPAEAESDVGAAQAKGTPSNLGEQDRQGNININTTHQGLQKDR